MAAGVRIGPLDLRARNGEALRVEQVALAAATGVRVPDDRAQVFLQHAQRPGFRCVGATTPEDGLVGFGYGYVEQPGSWWRQHVEPALTAAGQPDRLDTSFTVAELHVRPERQREGIGRALLGELLQSVDQPQVLLTTQQDGNPSRAFYRQLGFVEISPVAFPGLPVYVVLGRDLPLPPQVQVRRATEADIPAIRAVAYGTWPVTYAGLRSPQGIRRGLASWWSEESLADSVQQGGDLVATVDGAVIGVARHDLLEARYAPRPGWAGVPVLWCLYVLPAWHGVGAGKALLAATLRDVDRRGPAGRPRLVLDCVDGNDRATSFYQRQGMRKVVRQEGSGDQPACWWFEMPAMDPDPLA
jgi:ribosomal protein S18 acetylase RimI-like enzyme